MLFEADKKYINGKIYSIRTEGECFQAFCVKDKKILAAGSNAQIEDIPAGEVIDLQGKCVLPGFIDCHQHALEYAKTCVEVDLRAASSKEELLRALKARAEVSGPGAWIKGSGFDHEKFPDKQFPTAQDPDEISRVNPIIISRYCVH